MFLHLMAAGTLKERKRSEVKPATQRVKSNSVSCMCFPVFSTTIFAVKEYDRHASFKRDFSLPVIFGGRRSRTIEGGVRGRSSVMLLHAAQ